MKHASDFPHFHIQMAIMKQGDMKYVLESVSDDKTTLVDYANPFMSGPQVLLGALLIVMSLQRTRFSFRCLILLKDLRKA